MNAGHPALYVLVLVFVVAAEFFCWALYQLHWETHKSSSVRRNLRKQLRMDRYGSADGRDKAGASSRPVWY
jgi:hypothetical protein